MSSDALVTGVGMVTPAGRDAQSTWRALLAGGRYVRPLTDIDRAGCRTDFAGRIGDWSPPGDTENHDRICQFAVAAAEDALADRASCGDSAISDTVVLIGSSKGGIESFALYNQQSHRGRSGFDCTRVADIPPDSAARRVAERFGCAGMHVTVAACTTGTLAVIRGVQMLGDGDAEQVLCGGADASLHPLWFAAFEQMGALAPRPADGDVARSCRPFDRSRAGLVLGEGAGVLRIETPDAARRAGRTAIARILGYACTTDPAGLTQVSSDATALSHAIRLACSRAGIQPADLACIHAHGTGTRINDAVEARAIHTVLGPAVRDVPVWSAKAALGHLLGGAGGVELGLAALSCRDRVCPGNVNLTEPDPELGDLNLPRDTFDIRPGPVLKLALGFGGHLAAVVLGPP